MRGRGVPFLASPPRRVGLRTPGARELLDDALRTVGKTLGDTA